LRGEALDEAFACNIKSMGSKYAIMSLLMYESIISYVFDDFENIQNNLSFITICGKEAQGHFSTGFIQIWLAVFHYDSYLTTGKRMHRRLARISHRKVHFWSKTGTETLYGPNCLLNAIADLCIRKSSSKEIISSFEEAAKACHIGKIPLFEALAYERLSRVVGKDDPSEMNRYDTYKGQAIAVYRKWGAIAKAEHLEKDTRHALK
jgi:hypothetical protein